MYVEKEGQSLKVSHSSSSEEFYPLRKIMAVQPIYHASLPAYRGAYAKVVVEFEGDDLPDLHIFMDQVNNQATWTASQSGVDNAASDINRWSANSTDPPSQRIDSASGAVSGDYWCLVPEVGTVTFTTATPLNADYPDLSGDDLDKYIYGRWTDLEVSSGVLIAYYY
jgi:hypothetical protein